MKYRNVLGFTLGVLIPAVCAYGIYHDFKSVAAAVLAFFNTAGIMLMLGNTYDKLTSIERTTEVLLNSVRAFTTQLINSRK